MFLQTGRNRLIPHCFNVHIIPQPPVQPLSGCDELRQIAPPMAFFGEKVALSRRGIWKYPSTCCVLWGNTHENRVFYDRNPWNTHEIPMLLERTFENWCLAIKQLGQLRISQSEKERYGLLWHAVAMTYNNQSFQIWKFWSSSWPKLGSQSESGGLSEAKIGTAGTVLSLVGKMFLGFSGFTQKIVVSMVWYSM